MYVESTCAYLTPQGQAIKEAAVKFGDGETLCFTPCKKGYIPIINGQKMYACPLHNKERLKRVMKEGFRRGEMDLNTFWDKGRDSCHVTKNTLVVANEV